MKRCFIAAWPTAITRKRLAQLTIELAAGCDGCRAMRPENLHLTLAFIGNLDESTATRVAHRCREIHVTPFEWRLDTLAYFAGPRVLAAAGKQDTSLELLAAAARGALDELAVDYDRKPFFPHVTLLRKVARYDGAFTIAPGIEWTIDNLALYESTQAADGASYRRVE